MILATTMLALIVLIVAIYGVSQLWSIVSGAQLVTTPPAAIKQLVTLVPKGVFVELGSGLGAVSRAVGRRPHTSAIGIDISPLWVFVARVLGRRSRATFRVGNIYTTNLQDADSVYCYLLPEMLTRLESKFEQEMKVGSRVITYAFPLPNRTPTTTIERTAEHGPLFLYIY